MKLDDAAEKKLLITTIGGLTPLVQLGFALDFMPTWILVICLVIHGAAYARLNYILKPDASTVDVYIPTGYTKKETKK